MGIVLPPNIPHRAGTHYPILPSFAGTIFMTWLSEAVIYCDTAQYLYPPGDETPAFLMEGGNDDHSATTAHNEVILFTHL